MKPFPAGYLSGLGFGVFAGVVLTRSFMLPPVVNAQSTIWQVIAEPESVAGTKLAIVRHVTRNRCFVVSSAGIEQVGVDLCMSPEESADLERQETEESRITADAPTTYWRFGPEATTSQRPYTSQPSVPQSTKQPGVPK